MALAVPFVGLLSFVLLIHVVSADDQPTRDNKRHILAMQRALQKHRDSLRQRVTSCTSLEGSSPTHVHTSHRAVSRSRRSLPSDPDPMVDLYHPRGGEKGVYFSGKGEVLKWVEGRPLPAVNFTVETWVKPEGGQHAPVSFIGKFLHFYSAKSQLSWLGWYLCMFFTMNSSTVM